MRRALLLLPLLLFAEVHAQPEPCMALDVGFEALIREHVVRYPEMSVQDLYKLLHQATLGSEHAVTDTAAARRWLERETALLGPGPREPLLDTLGATGRYVRVHLRPYLAANGQAAPLLAAFIATGAQAPPGLDAIRCAHAAARRLAGAGELPWTAAEIEAYFSAQAEQQYPAEHHSPAFVAHYRPAYRLVALEFLDMLALDGE